MPELKQYKETETINVLFAGCPKAAGKSTAAMSAPGNKLLLKYDIGVPSLPPRVDPKTVFVREYPPSQTDFKPDSDKWIRPKNVGGEIIQDIFNIREAVMKGVPPVVGHETLPWPLTPKDSVVLDGYVQHSQHLLDWILAVNGKHNPEDFENKFAAWGKTLNQKRILLDMILPLPVNVVITVWTTAETERRLIGTKLEQVETGRVVPDMGGKMDVWGPGKVDSAVYLYSELALNRGLRFYARIRPNEKYQWVGIRNNYGNKDVIDLTITEQERSLPWERIFSHK